MRSSTHPSATQDGKGGRGGDEATCTQNPLSQTIGWGVGGDYFENLWCTLPADCVKLSSWKPMRMPSLVCADNLLSCRIRQGLTHGWKWKLQQSGGEEILEALDHSGRNLSTFRGEREKSWRHCRMCWGEDDEQERRCTHLRSGSILTGAALDSSTSTGWQRSTGPQALDQVLSGARLSSA